MLLHRLWALCGIAFKQLCDLVAGYLSLYPAGPLLRKYGVHAESRSRHSPQQQHHRPHDTITGRADTIPNGAGTLTTSPATTSSPSRCLRNRRIVFQATEFAVFRLTKVRSAPRFTFKFQFPPGIRSSFLALLHTQPRQAICCLVFHLFAAQHLQAPLAILAS